MLRKIILDTETTGLSPEEGHRIIEIGCVELINRRLTGGHFHYYVNPERAIDEGARAVHGITDAFLADKPKFSEIVEEWINYVQDAELVIHNAPFDVSFLNKELMLAGYKKTVADYCPSVVDTLLLARKKHPGQHNNLNALCKRYHVDHSGRDWHGALLDAELLSQVYLAMTGGQMELFDFLQAEVVPLKHQALGLQQASTSLALPILKPSCDELEQHHLFLEKVLNININQSREHES